MKENMTGSQSCFFGPGLLVAGLPCPGGVALSGPSPLHFPSLTTLSHFPFALGVSLSKEHRVCV